MTTPLPVRRLAALLAAGGIFFGLAGGAEAQVVRDHRGTAPKYKTPTPSCPNGQCAPGTVIRDHRGGTHQVRVCNENSYNFNYCKSHSH